MVKESTIKYKVTLMGDGGVGKTSLVLRYVHNEFDEKYMKTLGTNVYTKEVHLPTSPTPTKAVIQIWDVMGQRAFKSVIKSALDNANGVILVCDLSDEDSLKNLVYWIKIIYNNTKNVSFMFLGNKDDLDTPKFGLPALFSLSASFGSKAFLTSAKTGNNVERAFFALTQDIYAKRYIPPKGKFDFNIDDVVSNPMIKVEDKLINTFCLSLGGLEKGMPIVKKIFDELELDFLDPTKEELEAITEAFSIFLEEFEPEKHKELSYRLKKILKELD
jgi:small GTP-binding protein